MKSFSHPHAAYVHVPFCYRRCGYCNFTLVAGRDDLIEPYIAAIEQELALLREPREVKTLFFGGGTPTRLPPRELARLLKIVLEWFPLASDGELSVEANPADITAELATVLSSHGVTRVSLGAQSFNEGKLKQLERDHTPQQVRDAVRTLRSGGNFSLSLDLIFAAPGETLASWQHDLREAIGLRPDHISTYGLTFEQGTTFWSRLRKGDLAQLDEELERSMYASSIDTLTAAGFEHYEVSNFSQPGHRCAHNEIYWSGDEYFAVGPGAARYVSGRREMNHRSTTTWLKRIAAGESPTADWEELESEDRARELLVFGLRRLEGIEPLEFERRTGFLLESLAGEKLHDFIEHGLLQVADGRLRLTRQGLFVSDSIWPHFLRR